jgi:hypothetical protein
LSLLPSSSDFRLPTSDFRLPTSDFRLPFSFSLLLLTHNFFHFPSFFLSRALCAKQWKIWKVFGNNSLKKIVVTDKDLLLIVCLVLAPTWIILVVWSSANTPDTHTEKDDDNTLHLICRDEPSTLIYIIVLVVYEGLLLLGNSCLAFRTRHMPSSYSETKLIAFAVSKHTLFHPSLSSLSLPYDHLYLSFPDPHVLFCT